MATSSALGLGDLALVWDELAGAADLVIIDGDLGVDRGLVTAALLSLLLDRRAQPDDAPPSGDPNDRRGWWADEFADIEGDLIGSRMWLLDRSVNDSETARKAEEFVREALQWMLDDRVVASIDVAITTTADRMLITVTLHRPGKDPVSFRFAHVWDAIT